MTDPSTGRAEDLKRPCRNHSQENPPASICVFYLIFFIFFVFFFRFVFKTMMLHKKGKQVVGRQEPVSNTNAVFLSLTLLVFLPFSLIKVTPMQIIPRNTDRCCHSLTHTEPALFIMYFPVAGKRCFYSSTSHLRSNAFTE